MEAFSTLVTVFVFTATMQMAAQTACRFPDDMRGEWEWKQQSDSEKVPHGRFSVETELNGKATLLRFQWVWPKEKTTRELLFVIHRKAQSQENYARYFDESGAESDCTVDVSKSPCTVSITCAAAVPPKYWFSLRSQEEMDIGFSIPPPSMRGDLVPLFPGVAHRSKASK